MKLEKCLLVFLGFLSTIAFADPNWTKVEFANECGFSRNEAYQNTLSSAKEVSTGLMEMCTKDGGTYRATFSDGPCLRNPGDLTCPYECDVTVRGYCRSK